MTKYLLKIKVVAVDGVGDWEKSRVGDDGSPVGVWEWGRRCGDWRVSDPFSLGFFFHIVQCKTTSFCTDNLKKKKS